MYALRGLHAQIKHVMANIYRSSEPNSATFPPGTGAESAQTGSVARGSAPHSQSSPSGSTRLSGTQRALCCDCDPTSSWWLCSGLATRRPSGSSTTATASASSPTRARCSAGSRPDAEDALQDVFVRAYGVAARRRPADRAARLALPRRAQPLRRPAAPAGSAAGRRLRRLAPTPLHDPLVETERREDLRRLVQDVRRLPAQQRSALLMRELEGLTLRRARRRAGRHASRPSSRCSCARGWASSRRPRRATPPARRSATTSSLAHEPGRPRERLAPGGTCATAPAAATTATALRGMRRRARRAVARRRGPLARC